MNREVGKSPNRENPEISGELTGMVALTQKEQMTGHCKQAIEINIYNSRKSRTIRDNKTSYRKSN